ncbi:hypothetical protein [Thioclava sp. SK-1]|uniref:hypothetical protein n=1 Tax=Thioclava sp. SK-1 TaxID=1889770 RepID=UPI000824D9BD|nr:hypothetical protein [Thioclava sp. SK-1]
MPRHILDHSMPQADGARLRHFLDLTQKEGISRATEILTKRARARQPARKVQEFLRIERQEHLT